MNRKCDIHLSESGLLHVIAIFLQKGMISFHFVAVDRAVCSPEYLKLTSPFSCKPGVPDPPAYTSQVLGLQVSATVRSSS